MGPCTCDFNQPWLSILHIIVRVFPSFVWTVSLHWHRQEEINRCNLESETTIWGDIHKLLKKWRRQERLSLNKTQKSQYKEKTFGKFANINSQNLCSSRHTKKKVQRQGTNEDLYHINPTMWVTVTIWEPEQRPVNGFAKKLQLVLLYELRKGRFSVFSSSCYLSNIFLHLGPCTVGSSSYKHTNTCPKPRSQSLALPQPLPQPHPLTHGWGLAGVPATLLSVLPFVGSPSRTTLRCPLLPPPCRSSPVSGRLRGLKVDGKSQHYTLRETEIGLGWAGLGRRVLGEKASFSSGTLMVSFPLE